MSNKISIKNATTCINCEDYLGCPITRRYSHLLSTLDNVAEDNINLKATIRVSCGKFNAK